MIACLARHRRVPVIFAAESYKFCEKVQLDSIVFNELGDYRELLKPEADSDPQVKKEGKLRFFNLKKKCFLKNFHIKLTSLRFLKLKTLIQ